jgi:hypothetical protein
MRECHKTPLPQMKIATDVTGWAVRFTAGAVYLGYLTV